MSSRPLASVNGTLATPMTRRSALRVFATAGIAVATVGSLGRATAQISTQQHTSQLYTVSASANFRTGPGTSHSIISVISKGATFTLNGQTQNGYAGISYQSRSGWVIADLVVAAGSTPTSPVISGQAITTANVNLRSGPNTSHPILRVIPKGARVTTYDKGYAGFLMVGYDGTTGYAAAAYLAPPGSTPPSGSNPVISGQGRTTSSVNLRSGPGTSNQILRVVPNGVTIGTSTTVQNGFRYVSYSGQTGWMADAYISFTDGGVGNGPVPNYLTTTAHLNLRAEPSTSAKVLLVIPAGGRVTPHGLTTNGFDKVTYNGTVGWASRQYLK